MKLQFFFILLFSFFEKMQIICQNEIIKDKLIKAQNPIQLKNGEIQEEFLTHDNPIINITLDDNKKKTINSYFFN